MHFFLSSMSCLRLNAYDRIVVWALLFFSLWFDDLWISFTCLMSWWCDDFKILLPAKILPKCPCFHYDSLIEMFSFACLWKILEWFISVRWWLCAWNSKNPMIKTLVHNKKSICRHVLQSRTLPRLCYISCYFTLNASSLMVGTHSIRPRWLLLVWR